MIHYHKRGGLHFLRIGRLRVQWSVAKKRQYKRLPYAVTLTDIMARDI
jgi:hypothetical protein